MALMSFSAYARHRKCSAATVTRAVQAGRILCQVDEKTGRRVIDSDAADAAWVENSDQSKGGGAPAAVAPGADPSSEPPGDGADDGGDPEEPEEPTDYLSTSASYSLHRAKREGYNAELARLKLEQAKGSLVLAADVQKHAFEAARVIRESILNIPERLAAPLAGEIDPARIHRLLKEELTKALEGLANGL